MELAASRTGSAAPVPHIERVPLVVPLVVHVFPAFAVGGAQVRFTAIANHFGRAFRHIVVSLNGDLACRDKLDPGLDVTFPEIVGAKHAMVASALRFRRLLRQWKPDMLVTYNWGAIEFALANLPPVCPHIHIVDGFGPEEAKHPIRRRVLLRRLVLRHGPVVLPSRTLVGIARDVWKLPPRVIRYVPNGIDLAHFARGEAGRGGDGAVIGTVAGLRPEKNIARLLRAFAALPEGRLVIVGDGPERRGLEALAGVLGVAGRVTFAGHQTDTAPFYAGFDVLALSSDTEQMPLSVMEAMAAGLPVVSTAVGDVRQMVAEENAAFITPLDDDAFARALGRLIGDSAGRRRIGLANQAKARRDFDQEAMFAAHGALWRGT